MLEHVAIWTRDLEGMKDFYCAYFDGKAGAKYRSKSAAHPNFESYFLTFGDGSRLELMNRPQMQREPKGQMRTGYIHLAFSLGSREAVDALTERLRQDGYPVLSGPRVTGDGYYESCVLDPEENQIELTV